MVNDLIQSGKLLALKKDSVTHLLGEPTADTTYMMDYVVDMKCENEKFAKMILYIELDPTKDKVIKYWLTD